MHAPSVLSLLVSGLAASTVTGFELRAPGAGSIALSRRSVALMAALAGPALALPTEMDVRSPHHQGKKAKGNKREEDLEAREPHHQGKKGS